MTNTLLPILIISLLITATPFCISLLQAEGRRSRLNFFRNRDAANETEPENIEWQKAGALLRKFGDRLGRAGFVTSAQRRTAKLSAYIILFGSSLIGAGVALISNLTVLGTILCTVGSAYFGLLLLVVLLRWFEKDHERELLFQTPIFLESLVLLVESGLGILPALERLVRNTGAEERENPVNRLYRLVYELSASGMPFTQALETVADASPQRIVRHVMLHLDISGSEGGELIPSLRALSDHSHAQWRLSVEQRVRRLENVVVFPVFGAVIGLMLLTSAVPIVPLLDLKDILDKRPVLGQSDGQLLPRSPSQHLHGGE